MDQVGFDGIYGEADTWLSDADIVIADDIAKRCLNEAVLNESANISDLDEHRSRRKQSW